jgi:N-(2-amino-2-carboxyethyl)-L-glutamate synthase
MSLSSREVVLPPSPPAGASSIDVRSVRRARTSVLDAVGDTPLIRVTGFLERSVVRLHVKLEAANPGGSAKDRPAMRMIEQAVADGRITRDTVIVESTSGNTGIGLAQACRFYGLRCILVIDERARPQNVAIMRALGAELELVTTPRDPTVDLLSARLTRVVELVTTIDDAYWPDQYSNLANPRSHALGTMAEIDAALDGDVDVVFVAVSSTGTLGGCLDHIRSRSRSTRVVAVDAFGSVLFGGTRAPRIIPGLGAGCLPALAHGRSAQRLVRVSDLDCVVGCRRVAASDALLVGGSAGGVLQAVRMMQDELAGLSCVVIAADSGHRYLDTIFDDDWVERTLGCPPDRLAELVGPAPVGRL